MAHSTEVRERRSAARLVFEPVLQILLARDSDPAVLFNLSRNDELCPEALEILLECPDECVQVSLVSPDRGLSAEQMERVLANNGRDRPKVLAAAAHNPILPLSVRVGFALECTDERVLVSAVATLSASELGELANDSNPRVRKEVSNAIITKAIS